MAENPRKNRWSLAACTVAVAAAVGGTSSAAASPEAIDQIQRYCAKGWQNAGIARQDWQDCTQQALMELLERVSNRGLGEAIDNVESQERRELNRTVWRTIQRWRRRPKAGSFEESTTRYDAAVRVNHSEAWDEILLVARDCLTVRQQRILELTREGWKTSEIAGELGLTAARVSDEKYKGISKLRSRVGIG